MFCDIDLEARGRQIGSLHLVHSDDRHAFGHVPVPVAVLSGAPGPTVLLVAGTHGDEYEGQAILLGLIHALEPATLNGRVVVLPGLNRAAIAASRRVSPLDGVNLNRAFLDGAPSGPTRAIAAFVETLLPSCALVADIHSGGSAAVYADAVLATRTEDRALFAANVAAARATRLPFIQLLVETSSSTSLNSASAAAGVPMVAMELGGGGKTARLSHTRGRDAVLALLIHAGVLVGDLPAAKQRVVAIRRPHGAVVAPSDGVVEPLVMPGDDVAEGGGVAVLHHWREPHRPPLMLRAAVAGVVLAVAARGRLEPGDHAALIAEDAEDLL